MWYRITIRYSMRIQQTCGLHNSVQMIGNTNAEFSNTLQGVQQSTIPVSGLTLHVVWAGHACMQVTSETAHIIRDTELH